MQPNSLNNMHNEIGAGDDVDNLCSILENASHWFNLRGANLDAPEVGNSVVSLYGATADVERCVQLLKALGYGAFTRAPFMARTAGNFGLQRLDVDVIAIAEVLAS